MSSQISQTSFFEVGDKTSLICADADTAQTVKETLHDLGFKFQIADTPEAGLERILYTDYDCIVIHENFGGSSLHSNPLLHYLEILPMMQRRNWFVCLVGPSFKTLDAMQAFARSVHLVLHPSDLQNLTAILKKGLAEFDRLYRSYREASSQISKDGRDTT